MLQKPKTMRSAVFLVFFISFHISAQTLSQNLTGKVADETTGESLAYATVVILESDPVKGTITDIDGNFTIPGIPPGRYALQASYIGYEPLIIPEVLVTGGKETVLSFLLREVPAELGEVVVKPRIQKEKALNPVATVSARMLSLEEAGRYAGGFDDPARLATAFAGVTTDISSNAIVIRGNAPKFLHWRLEGVEIPNPNHFADLSAFGGGGLTALSSNLLDNSDFFTGAFPAEYNNALSGVFDLKMRTGNASERAHSVQVGLIGIDLASEGPFSKKHEASYLFNYRYSTLALVTPLLPEDAEGTRYQDLSFKFHFPTAKAGVFSLWGIGLADTSGQEAETDPTLWIYDQDRETQRVKQYMGASGIAHRYLFSPTARLQSTLAFSGNGIDLGTDRMSDEAELRSEESIDSRHTNLTFTTQLYTKLSGKYTQRTGFSLRSMGYDLLLRKADEAGDMVTIADGQGHSTLLSGFTNASLTFKDLSLQLGITAQYFTLNKNYTIEPRAGLSWQVDDVRSLHLGYGLHSRLEPLNIYFTEVEGSQPNKPLDFTKAHHFVLGYHHALNTNTHLKIEPYYQYLFDVPVTAGGTAALLNLKNDWFVSERYLNEGFGRNYGIDLTLERYLHRGFYYLFTASLFKAEYQAQKGGDWFSTRYNQGYLLSALGGKEFRFGGSGQHLLGINLRLNLQGGERYSGIDTAASAMAQEVVYETTTPFTEQAKAAFTTHFTVSYQWSRPEVTHEFSLKLLNATQHEEFLGHRFNFQTQQVEEHREPLMIPNLSYKISF